MTPSPWRTVATVLTAVVMMLAGFIFAVLHGLDANGAAAYASLCIATATMVTGQAAKATVEAIAQGGGTAAIKAVLTTDAKPGDPP